MMSKRQIPTFIAALMACGLVLKAHASANDNACIVASEHVREVLGTIAGDHAATLESLTNFEAARRKAQVAQIQQASEAFRMPIDQLNAQVAAEQDALRAQMTSRFGKDKLYRDFINMLTSCKRLAGANGLGQSEAAYDSSVGNLEALIAN